MGLGKTAQATAALWWQAHFAGAGPFLVVAPLTTLGHWAREIATWTPLHCVTYAGSAADREVCRGTEWWREGETPWEDDGGAPDARARARLALHPPPRV